MRHFLCFTLCLLFSTSYGQEPNFRHFGSKEGLVGSVVYRVQSDSNGLMWFCSNRGLSSFNGDKFLNYNASNGLPYAASFHMDKDANGKVWVISFEDKACYFEDHSLKIFSTPYDISWFSFDSNGNSYFFTINGHVLQYKSDSLIKDIAVSNSAIHQGCVLRNGRLVILSLTNGLLEVSGGKTRIIQPLKAFAEHGPRLRLFKIKNDRILVADGQKIYELVEGKLVTFYSFTKESGKNSSILDLYEDNTGDIWICKSDGLYKLTKQSKESECFLGNTIISSICQDREGNYWVSTMGNGVYMFRYKTVENVLFENGKDDHLITVAGFSKDSVYCFYSNGSIRKVTKNGDKYVLKEIIKAEPGEYLVVKRDINGCFLLSGPSCSKYFDGKNIHEYAIPQFRSEGLHRDFYNLNDNHDLFRFKGRNWELNEHFGKANVNANDFGRMYCYTVKNDTVWAGNHKGLFLITDSFVYRPFKDSIASVFVYGIERDSEGVIWVATTSHGVYYVQNDRIKRLTDSSIRNLRECNTLFRDNFDNIWVSCTDGFFKIEKKGNGSFKIKNYSNRGLLQTTVVTHIYVHDHIVYVTTQEGLIMFNENSMLNDTIPAPLVYITDISVNNRTADRNLQDLGYKANNIKIEYTAVSYSWNKAPIYYFCLAGKDSTWHSTTNTHVEFLYLSPGDYTFYVFAESIDGKRSAPKKIGFTIRSPFWQTWWFYLMVVLITMSIGWLIVRHYKRIGKREKQYLESELKALRAQMNPHFIFNALNAIQEFALNNDKSKANYYLVQFSKLMRGILENSKKNVITIKQEIEFLKLYLEIESFRFDDKFTYSIFVSEDIDTAITFIPSMIMQPIVENAINHGLAPKKTRGHLKIEVTKEDNSIKCVIEDNGVGRSGKQSETHVSSGILTTESRLKLMNQAGTKSIKITDLLDEQGNSVGTRVEQWIKLV